MHQKRGKMTTRVTYVRGDTPLGWSWPATAGEDGQLQALRQSHTEFAEFCGNLSEE